MFTLQSAHSPVYATQDGTSITLMVKFAEFNEEHSFCATSNDLYDHCREIYERAIAKEFGEIAPFPYAGGEPDLSVPVTQRPDSPQPIVNGVQTL